MDSKEEYKKLVETIKSKLKESKRPHRNQDLAQALGYSRTHFSTLLGESGNITDDHLRVLKLTYRDVLENQTVPNKETPVPISTGDQDILRMLAESNLKLSNSHAEMVQMLKQRVVIPNSDLLELKENQMAILNYLKVFAHERAQSHGSEAEKVLGETGKAIAGNAGSVQKTGKSVERKKHNS